MTTSARILVIEDEPLSRDMLVRRLSSRSFNAVGVESASQAFEYLQKHPVDLILMDNDLPEITGLEAVRILRQTWSHDSLPIIMVSAMVDSDDIVDGLQAGANDYVIKPINFSVLMARIQTSLTLKNQVSALMEAERQRVMVHSLTASAARIAEPFGKMIDELEAALQNTDEPRDQTTQRLHRLLEHTESVVEQIEEISKISARDDATFIERMDELKPE